MLETLRSIYHYDPLTGAITHLTHRGPKKPGDSAITSYRRRPVVWIDNQRWPAARLAWLLHTGEDPVLEREHEWFRKWCADMDPDHAITIWCKDGDLFNLAFGNLAPREKLQPLPKKSPSRVAKRRAELGICKVDGGWRVAIQRDRKRHYVGTFDSRHEAIAAKATAEELLADGLPADFLKTEHIQRSNGKPKLKTGLAFDRYRSLIVNYWLESDQKTRDSVGVDINHFRYHGTTFGNVNLGTIFWYEDRWHYKTSVYGAWTCDAPQGRPNKHKSIRKTARVKIVDDWQRLDRKYSAQPST